MNHVWRRSILFLPLLSLTIAASSAGQSDQRPKPFTIEGNVALWTVAIKADKTADFETIMGKLREALGRSAKAERRQQVAGWKVMRVASPLADGTIAYVHIINPVVPGADYTIMQALYDEFPDERQALYDMYRGAFAKNLSLASGTIALDLSTSTAPGAPPAASTAAAPPAP
jgi:hypothetical protein